MGKNEMLENDSYEDMSTEDRILNAALETVEDYTISGTRMHLIAEKAQMVQSNVHYYYRTKEALLLALHKKVLDTCYSIRQEDVKKAGDCLEEQLDVFLKQKKKFLVEKTAYDTAEIDFWVQSRIKPKIRERMRHSFDAWRKEIRRLFEIYCPDMPEERKDRLPSMLVSLMEGATIQYHLDPEHFDVDGYFDMCREMILQAAGQPEEEA